MTLFINGVDYSSYIQQKTDIVETPRKVYGDNKGVSVSGKSIIDLKTMKYDLSVRLKPMAASVLRTLIQECEDPTVSVSYTSFYSDSLRQAYMIATVSSVTYLTDKNGTGIYGEAKINFEER